MHHLASNTLFAKVLIAVLLMACATMGLLTAEAFATGGKMSATPAGFVDL
jgi:hypothetical protein